MNLNKLFNDVADEQGIEPGSSAWIDGGIMPYSGTTGGQPSYGWKHSHKLSANWVKAVVANYAHRRAYYADLTIIPRKTGYEDGGRPCSYTPELPGDQLGGETLYITSKSVVKVTGPDILHFQLSPLFALFDSGSDYEVMVQGKLRPASFAASVLIRFLLKSLAGMLTQPNGKVATYVFGDRGSSTIMGATVEAAKRDLVDQQDLNRIYEYIDKTMLPFFDKAPGLTLNEKPKLIDGMQNTQAYNGLYWLLPRFYDAMVFAPEGAFKEHVKAIVTRWSQNIEDMEVLVPGQGVNAHSVTLTPAVIAGDNGKPLPTWKGYLTAENIKIEAGGSDWSLWGLRAQFVAAKVLNSEILKKSSGALAAKQKAKGADKAWLVDAEGDYL